MHRQPLRSLMLAVLVCSAVLAEDRPDLTVADFEGERYQPWVAAGDAFGEAPARGAWPGQMAVEGFEGKGLVNSFRGGDDSTGSLTSPPFGVERRALNFLIGGGKYPGETCLDLLVDGRVVRTATGPNDRPGGSERLDWASWDVAEFVGQSAVLRVVDRRKGGWGHINVDQIVQSDRPRGVVRSTIEMVAERAYLLLPVAEKDPMRRVKVAVDGQVAHEFDIKLAEGEPDFSTFLDLSSFRGKRLEIASDLPAGSKALGRINPAEVAVDPTSLYREEGRPRFHFTSRRGWLNDPNGLVFFEGEYHLFYQHNPYGWEWGNMHWGHAVSPDLVHWKELPIALYPREYGDWAFSGSAVVDRENTSGFGDGIAPPLVAAYTSTARGECIIYSRDRGRTWVEYPGNPVVRHAGRDPRLLWHAPSKHWVMAVYDEEGGRRDVAFHTSPDLKTWTFASRSDGYYECPDLFELPVEGRPGETMWVLTAADGAYRLGRFDGRVFTPEPGGKKQTWHGHFYAAQSFSDEPKGRRVQIGWAQGINFPGQAFNQQMTTPCELTLRPTEDGVRLFANPVSEVDSLRSGESVRSMFDSRPVQQGQATLSLPSDLLDLRIEIEVGARDEFELEVPGAIVRYDAARRILACNGVSAALDPVEGAIKLRLLVDRGSIEVFANDGRVVLSRGLGDRKTSRQLIGRLAGQGLRVRSLKVAEMASSWR
jgi:fructan beta-fructosidase